MKNSFVEAIIHKWDYHHEMNIKSIKAIRALLFKVKYIIGFANRGGSPISKEKGKI